MAKPVARNPISTKYILSHEKQKVNLFLQNEKKTSGMRIMPNAEFQIPIYRSASNLTVGGDAYIAPRANVGIGPYGRYRRCTINRNLPLQHFCNFCLCLFIKFSHKKD